ncbi:hypothetical protein QCD70_11070 [Agreia sp. PsM10]|uniref:hypothetical protein n=1 Tax=Agreia sp. PsM10 TaxID=3030533 RepID=UPI00263B402C|nr:hypothetical protein [Agreia sp. PsM10]MDN4640786.1 hypothetical protein [Agreia sp. PsM10]
MTSTFEPSSIILQVVQNGDAPLELQSVGAAYWSIRNVDIETGEPVWAHRTSDIGFKVWSGTAHYAAAAAVSATAPSFECSTCGEPLTLASRRALTDAIRGKDVECRSCNPSVNERAAKILDPKAIDERSRRASATKAAQLAAVALRELDDDRRSALAKRYPVEDTSGEYLLDRASFLARIGALTVIHATGDHGGLVYPVETHTDEIGPNYSLSHELFKAAWWEDLLQIHPSSPLDAFVWNGSSLGDSIYANRVRFFFPGVGTLEKRREDFARDLRLRLSLPTMWSTERAELSALAGRIIADESGRYFVHMLREHNLPDLTETHEEALRTTTTRGARSFAIGHLYRMAWSSARDASSAHQRHSGMSKENAITYGLKQLERWVQRAIDNPSILNEPFNEDKKTLPLSAVTGVVFRTIMGLDPMTASSADIADALRGSPDSELLRQCDQSIPDRHELIEWIRTSNKWDAVNFRRTVAQLEDWEPELCAPHCAHDGAGRVAKESGRLFDRVIARVGDRDAVILTSEATAIANALREGVRTGDALLGEIVRLLDDPSHASFT